MKFLIIFLLVTGALARHRHRKSEENDPPVFAFFAGHSTPDHVYVFEKATDILRNPKFVTSNPTVIYIHDFLETLSSDTVKLFVEAYAERNDHNVIVLDWHDQATFDFLTNAIPNVDKVGEQAAQAVLDLVNNGLSAHKLHIVGLGLGAQMAGVVGRTVKDLSHGETVVSRITALDPASSGYYGIPGKKYLSHSDAHFVDLIHTDAGHLGANFVAGTVDFWPNGGVHPQPGCSDDVCSHQRSLWYYIESLIGGSHKPFNAIKASSWYAFTRNVVEPFHSDRVMGYHAPRKLRGNYYLVTAKTSPFAMGEDGVSYRN